MNAPQSQELLERFYVWGRNSIFPFHIPINISYAAWFSLRVGLTQNIETPEEFFTIKYTTS